MYRGDRGIVGAVAYGLTGICYKLVGTSSKLFGKILFAIFVCLIPAIFKGILKAFLGFLN